MRLKRGNGEGPSGSCRNGPKSPLRTLEDVVRACIRDYRPVAKREHDWYAKLSFEKVIEKAVLSRIPRKWVAVDGDWIAVGEKRHNHQTKLKDADLKTALNKVRSAKSSLSKATSFEQLFREVKRIIGIGNGIGDLTFYDIAERIGAHLGLEPELVYLHAGTLKGARALGGCHALRLIDKVLRKSDLPKAFQKLAPAEIENCLCNYLSEIKCICQPS